MGVRSTADPDPKALLAATLRDPFADKPATPVREWFNFLIEHFPLWSFQPEAFSALHSTSLPSRYPLARFVYSICVDERIRTHVPMGELEANLDLRRLGLHDLAAPDWVSALERADRPGSDGTPSFLPNRVGVFPPTETMSLRGSNSIYEEMGFDILGVVEDLQFAVDKRGRQEAKRAKDAYLRSIGTELARHGPKDGPPEALLEQLKEQGRGLFDLCWKVFPVNVSDATAKILRAAGASSSEEVDQWAARLALPVLSGPEILALGAESTRAAQWPKRKYKPTALRFTIWVLAHRLRATAATLARKLGSPTGVKYFHSPRQNPIKPYLAN